MSRSARRILTTLIPLALIALAACGSNRIRVCPLASNDSCCPAGDIACPIGPQHLYATGLSSPTAGQVTAFPITSNGGLGSSTSVSGPAATFGMTALNNQFLYVSNPALVSGGGPPSIYGWTIDRATGTLTTIPGSPFPPNTLPFLSIPNGMAADAALQIIYVADGGTIDALQADSTGKLTPISGSPFMSGGNLFLTIDPQNRFVFASDLTPPGNVLAFTIQPDGSLSAVAGSPFPAVPGSSTSTSTQPEQIVVDTSGSFVYTALVATGQVAGFSIDPTTGALTVVPGSPFAAGNHPLSLATFGSLLYVANAADGTISGYTINTTTGALTPVANSPFLIPAAALTIGGIGPTLYAAGGSRISAFTINTQTGGLTPVAGSPFTASGATVLTVVP